MPPRSVRMPCDVVMPWMSSGDVSSRTRITSSRLAARRRLVRVEDGDARRGARAMPASPCATSMNSRGRQQRDRGRRPPSRATRATSSSSTAPSSHEDHRRLRRRRPPRRRPRRRRAARDPHARVDAAGAAGRRAAAGCTRRSASSLEMRPSFAMSTAIFTAARVGPLGDAALQEVQPSLLERELDVHHVAVVPLERVADVGELLVERRRCRARAARSATACGCRRRRPRPAR